MSGFDRFINFLYRWRIWFVVAFSIVLSVMLFYVRKTDFSENIYDILPVDDDIVQAHLWAGKAFKKSNSLFFAVKRTSETSSLQADEFARRLRKINNVARVVSSVGSSGDFQNVYAYLPMFFDSSCASILKQSLTEESLKIRFARLKKGVLQNDYLAKMHLKTDPLGVADAFSPLLKRTFTFRGAKIEDFKIASDSGNSYLIILSGTFDCADSRKSAILIEEVENTIKSMKRDYPSFSVAYAGGYRISACNAQTARDSSSICVVMTIILMVAICFASFRNRRLALVAVVPSMIGSIVALIVVCSCFDRVSSISIAFASIAIGVSIDYAIHILYFIDEAKGIFTLELAKKCIRKYCLPITIVAGTTILAFIIMSCFGSRGFLQLGLFGVVGIFVSALVSVLWLPLFLVGLKLKDSQENTVVGSLAQQIKKIRAKSFIFVLFFVIPVLLVDFENLFNGDISFFNSLDSSAKADEAFLRSEYSNALSAKSILLRSDDFEKLLQDNEKLNKLLEQSKIFTSFGVHNLLISAESVSKNLHRWKDFWNDDFSVPIKKACVVAGLKSDMVLSANSKLVSNVKQITLDDIQKPPFYDMFANCLYIDDGNYALLASFYPNNNDEASAQDLLKQIESSFDNADIISADYLGKHIASTSATWLAYFTIIAFVVAGCYLLTFMRSMKAVVAILLPVILGLSLAVVVFSVLAVKINIINFVFVIFAVCLAQDYAVFVYNAVKNGDCIDDVYAPILVSSITTITAFVILAFSIHPAISSLGSASAISIASILIMVLLFGEHFSKWALGNEK